MNLYKRMTFASALFAAVLLPLLALAGTPDAGQSTVDDCLVTCPAGDIGFMVVVRDAAGAVCVNSVVEVDFCSCSGAQLCSPGGSGSCTDGTNDIAMLATNSAGEALFYLAEGGGCGGALVDIRADGVLLAQRTVHPMDTNGDFTVDASDFSTSNPLCDYNCDGFVGLPDTTIFSLHGSYAHSCTGPVGVAPRTWGSVKSSW